MFLLREALFTSMNEQKSIKNISNNKKKRGFSDLIEELIGNFLKIKKFRNYKSYIKICICIFLFLLLIGVICGAIYSIFLVYEFFNSKSEKLEVDSGIDEIIEESNFIDDKWLEHFGNFLRNEDDRQYFGLASTANLGLIKFYKPFSERQLVSFEFTPLSEETANVVLHINNLYEIVIGDSDYKTLTFKARESYNGPWIIIANKEGQLKKEMLTGIKKNTDVTLRMLSYCQMDGNYFVRLELKFQAEKTETEKDQFLSSEYVFNPPFQNCRPFNISVGLLNQNYKPNIEARFLSFEIKK